MCENIILVLDQKTDDFINMEERMKCDKKHFGHKKEHEQKKEMGKFWVEV